MTFYKPSGNGPVIGLVTLLALGIFGTIFFFSFRECKSSGILRSGKTSDATELYQIFPVQSGDKNYFLSLEGVFKTTIYNRQGGITSRSGSTDVRLTLHDLTTGEQVNRIVLGDYYKGFTKILGAGKNGFWLYNHTDGLHYRNIESLEVIIKPEDIIAKNKDLSEGFAEAQEHLGDLEELFSYSSADNALMVTTLSGKRMLIDASTFATLDRVPVIAKNDDVDDIVDEMMENAETLNAENIGKYTDRIMQAVADISGFSDIVHTTDRTRGLDSCTYTFEGNTIKTLERSDCPITAIKPGSANSVHAFIEPVFVASYDADKQQFVNLPFLPADKCLLLHASKIGSKAELLLSCIGLSNLQPVWTIKTGIVLHNHESAYSVNGSFGNNDTLFIVIDDQLLCADVQKGKLLWRSTVARSGYETQLYYSGLAIQNNNRYFLHACSYFTELSREGIFIHGRTDHQLIITDGKTGKQLNKITNTTDAAAVMPYYLGMADGKCWFYSNEALLHTRSLPDLKITGTPLKTALQKNNITEPVVKSDHYDGGIEERYIGFDSRNNLFYFTTENGLHYAYDLVHQKITEVRSPENNQFEKWMQQNAFVEFYRMHQQNMYQHDLLLGDGRILQMETNNSTGTLHVKNPDVNKGSESAAQINQFIEGALLTNGISISGALFQAGKFNAPLATGKEEKAFYIWHKDKITPEAHQMISKYNYAKNSIGWKLDITDQLEFNGEIVRIFTDASTVYCIFKTHPALDDAFTCIAINADSGKVNWKIRF